jgi:3-carboxy-cis,cis-muconate cycloisomerase
MSFTLQQSQLLSPLIGDSELALLFSADADLKAMLDFEVALAIAQAKLRIIPQAAADAIEVACKSFRVDEANLKQTIARDGMSVPGLIAQLRQHIEKEHAHHLHFGATSQDAIDTSLMLRAARAFDILNKRMREISFQLTGLVERFGQNALMAHTRMQRALPILVADRAASWQDGIDGALNSVEKCLFSVQFGGAVGTLKEFGNQAEMLTRELGLSLGLGFPLKNWHTQRGPVFELANSCSHLTGALGKLGQDYCLMAQNEFGEVKLSGGGTSSAMHHKQNPVQAETLVTLARFNATLVSGMHHSMVHEQERSGAAWTLEWMLLPQMIMAAGAAARIALEMLKSTLAIGSKP